MNTTVSVTTVMFKDASLNIDACEPVHDATAGTWTITSGLDECGMTRAFSPSENLVRYKNNLSIPPVFLGPIFQSRYMKFDFTCEYSLDMTVQEGLY